MSEKYTAYKAMRGYCFNCKSQSFIAVKNCTKVECSLFMYRFGKRPDSQELAKWEEKYSRKFVNNFISKETQKKGLEAIKKMREKK